jgi:hypothetical protein
LGAQAPLGTKVQFFTASGTYTPSIGALYAVIEGVGGGAGGGGCAGIATANSNNGGGGGAGATYSKRSLSIAQIGANATITVGAAGGGGAAGANSGTNGGTTTVTSAVYGTIISCPAGNGGTGGSQLAAFGQGGLAPSIGVGDISLQGGYGNAASYTSGTSQAVYNATNYGGAAGGGWGQGGRTAMPGAGATANGSNGTGYGAGGSGAMFQAVAANAPGGSGSPGAVMITEYGNFGVAYSPPVRGEIWGLEFSAAGGTTTFSTSAGQATDSTFVDSLALPSAYTKTLVAWAVGSGVGSLDTGTIANSTYYHAFVIKNPTTGVVDLLISLSATAPTLPSGFTLFRRIYAFRTDASGFARAMKQSGDEFLSDGWFGDASSVAFSTTAALVALTVPTGIQVNAIFNGRADFAVAAAVLFSSPDIADQAPTGALVSLAGSATATTATGEFNVRTDTLGRIRVRANATGPNYSIATKGWIDTRGRYH